MCNCESCEVIESQLGFLGVLENQIGLVEAIGVLERLIWSGSLHLGLIGSLEVLGEL